MQQMQMNLSLDLPVPTTTQMTPDQWAKIADNPIQRDTVARAKRADYLRTYLPTHGDVKMARLPDGTLIKIDGHTRSYMWQKGEIPTPKTLCVLIYDVNDMEEAKLLYTTIDSELSVEKAGDRLYGGMHEAGYSCRSQLLKENRFAGTLRFVEEFVMGDKQFYGKGHMNGEPTLEQRLANVYLPQIKAFDAIDPKKEFFKLGVLAAAFLTHLRYGDDSLEFWKRLNQNEGNKIGKFMDGVQALSQEIADRRASRGRIDPFHGRNNNVDLIGKAISSFDGFYAGTAFKNKANGIADVTNWIRTDNLKKLRIHPDFQKRSDGRETHFDYIYNMEVLPPINKVQDTFNANVQRKVAQGEQLNNKVHT